MLSLLALSTFITIVIMLPRSVYSTVTRTLCSACRYDLTGLGIPGTCPECGHWNSETTIVLTHWIMRWKLLPRIFAAMLIPALSPAVPALILTYIYFRSTSWGWSNSWYQATQRDLGFDLLFCFPFLLNGWNLLGMHFSTPADPSAAEPFPRSFQLQVPLLAPILNDHPVAQDVVDGVPAQRFWPALFWSTGLGLLGTAVFGWGAWLNRFTDYSTPIFITGIFATAAGLCGGRLVEWRTRGGTRSK